MREALRRRRAEGIAGCRGIDGRGRRSSTARDDGARASPVSEEVVLTVRRPLAGVRRPAGGAGRELRRPQGRDARHHRPERRRQDDALQPPERLHRADQGRRVLMGQENSSACRRTRSAALGVGRTFQVVRPFPRMTVLHNVVVGAFVAAADEEKASRACERGARARRPRRREHGALAGGLTTVELRLMELARALASRRSSCCSTRRSPASAARRSSSMLGVDRPPPQGGVTIVIIEHTMHAMVRLADRFVVLDHGACSRTGEPEEVTQRSERDRSVSRQAVDGACSALSPSRSPTAD